MARLKMELLIQGWKILKEYGPYILVRKIKRYLHYHDHKVVFSDSDLYYSSLSSAVKCISNSQSITFASLKPLHEAFKTHSVRSELLGDTWWFNYINAVRTLDDESLPFQKKLIQILQSSDFPPLEHWELLHMYTLTLRVGLFEVAYAIRSKALDIAISYLSEDKKMDGYKYISALSALLERGHYYTFQQKLGLLGEEFEEEKQKLIHLLNIIQSQNNQSLLPKDINSDLNEEDIIFHQFVKGKSVAIVGPARTDKPDAIHIDSHDLVVRTNYKEKGECVDPIIKGLRCDITYFNGETVERLCKQDIINWPDGISWAIFKSDSDNHKLVAILRENSKKIDLMKKAIDYLQSRNMYMLYGTFFNLSLMAIPNIIMDLLRFDPKKISIFHADLMLSVGTIPQYLPKDFEYANSMKKYFLMTISRSHDPVTQYWILHELWKNGKFEGDNRFNEIMSLGELEYMKQLQKIYGNYGRILS
ncbi:hypothetical protein DSECCO2_85560 [anaerobic digester metagenome]